MQLCSVFSRPYPMGEGGYWGRVGVVARREKEEGQMDRWMMDGWTEGWMDRWMMDADGWTDGWMNKQYTRGIQIRRQMCQR